ncbi:hypothetical protein BURPSPAST_Y0352 [Burkholderia pseudomallei Pasteur 52237]|nr:hypothetical protein BURPSPAST_Y0352 [Burkholderia pseudomallei Pasteur 52237]
MPERRAGRAMPVLRQDECRVRMRLAFFLYSADQKDFHAAARYF